MNKKNQFKVLVIQQQGHEHYLVVHARSGKPIEGVLGVITYPEAGNESVEVAEVTLYVRRVQRLPEQSGDKADER